MTTQYNRDIPGARFARGATGMIPLRLDGAPSDGPFRGQTLFRGVRRTEPGDLCRAFGIAEVGFRWELGPGLRGISGDNFARRSDSTASMERVPLRKWTRRPDREDPTRQGVGAIPGLGPDVASGLRETRSVAVNQGRSASRVWRD